MAQRKYSAIQLADNPLLIWNTAVISDNLDDLTGNGNVGGVENVMLTVGSVSGTFVYDEVVTEDSSSATGNFRGLQGGTKMFLKNISGTFDGSSGVGGVTGSTASATSSAVDNSRALLYGQIDPLGGTEAIRTANTRVFADALIVNPSFPITFEFFYKDVSVTDTQNIAQFADQGNANRRLTLRSGAGDTNDFTLERRDGGGAVLGITSTNARSLLWRHIVEEFTSTTAMRLLINGVVEPHDGLSTARTLPASTYDFAIGDAAYSVATNPVDGFFYRPAVYTSLIDAAAHFAAFTAPDALRNRITRGQHPILGSLGRQ